MLRALHVLLKLVAIIFVAPADAERPRISNRVLELDQNISGEEHCPQWLTLQAVLKKLGVSEPTPHLGGRILWIGCDVKEVNLDGHGGVNGTLDDEIENLIALNTLNLDNTDVTGDLESLQSLTKLEGLYLTNTQVTGDLVSLQGLTKLQDLYLSDTHVAGDLSSLQGLTQLQWVYLANAQVAGDLASLQGLKKLQGLDLSNTRVAGDFATLQALTQLEYLYLSRTHVAGELVSLQGLTKLLDLYLANAQVAGNLGSLQSLIQLHGFDLSNTRVAGDLLILQGLTKLRELLLFNTQVTGDLASLKRLTQLHSLNLANTQVSGNLSSLQGLTQVQWLYLSNTRVAGDLVSLQRLQLQQVYLQKTSVAGDLASIQGMTQLQYLYLSHTHVVGDLASLQGLAQVQWLYLTNTQVTGDLVSLQNLTELQRLFLKDTHIPGDLSSLQSLTHLQELSLANTQVAGDLGSLEKLRKLQRLNLASTHVAGDIAGLQGMTQMHRLNLANDQVAGNLSSLQGATGMQEFDLSNTSVEGELMVLLPWENVTAIDLQQTKVSGRLSSKWRGRWSKLRSLKLSGSRVEFLPQPDELEGLQSYYTTGHSDFSANAILPQLNLLELSGCPLDGDVKNLLLPLFGCPALATIDAASCGLSGTLTHLKLKMVQVNGRSSLGWTSLLSESLRLLNFASNNVSTIEGIPKQMKVIVLADNSAVDFATGVVKEALTAGTFVDMQNTTLSNSTEAAELLKQGFLVKTEQVSLVSTEAGYECHSIASTSLQISPEKFLPQELCQCLPGFEGTGARCHKCGQNTYSTGNGSACTPCPEGSNAGEGEGTCQCISGGEFQPHQFPACQCPEEQGWNRSFGKEVCVPCHKAHLRCPNKGTLLSSAPPEIGFARLQENDTVALPCLAPKNTRCNSTDRNGSILFGCSSGYGGILCSDCEVGHYLTKKTCQPCPTNDFTQQLWSTAAVAGGVGVLAVGLFMSMWLRQRWAADSTAETTEVDSTFSAVTALKEQVKQLAPILLQTCQLWAVLAALMKGESSRGSSDSWEIPYIEASQLSIDSLKGAMNLQCVWHDGAAVRLASALVAPVAPVVVLLCCVAMELCSHGFGIAAALKALTLFYVGGASSASKLLSCQGVDGSKSPLPDGFAFRKAVPHLLCDDSSWTSLDAVGCASIAFYGIVVPLCLAYLYARQHLALLPGKATTATAVRDGDQWEVQMTELVSEKNLSPDHVPVKGEAHVQRLLAASAAHIAVHMQGRIHVELKDGVVMAKPLSGSTQVSSDDPEGSARGSIDWQLANLTRLVEHIGKDSISRSRDLREAMMDRCLVEEAEGSESALAGSKHILFKYARCHSLYMEIVQKLVAVALVSVVNSGDGLQLSLAITLLMAAASGMVQPYFHPQANILQCCSFICLALAAVGFSRELSGLSRAALVVPFLLSAALALRPDSTECLAVRIWRQLEKLPKDGSLEIRVETVSFV